MIHWKKANHASAWAESGRSVKSDTLRAACLMALALLGVGIAFAPVSAQFTELELLPSGGEPGSPPVANAPDGGQWTIHLTTPYDFSRSRQVIPEELQNHPMFAERDQGRKMDRVQSAYSSGVRRDLMIYRDGRSHVAYRVEGSILARMPGSNRIIVAAADDFFTVGLSGRPDQFDPFGWVSPRFYLGTAQYGERLCDVYRQYLRLDEMQASRFADSPFGTDPDLLPGVGEVRKLAWEELGPAERGTAVIYQTAFIDRETRLPVALEHVKQGRWFYQFSPERTSFELPGEFAAALEELRDSALDLEQKWNIPQ